ncbi:MAG: TonB-dependent receptor plug domain-containing protein, partial [Pseudobdellovibrio sp.]
MKRFYLLIFLYVLIVNASQAKELNLVLSDPSFKTSSQTLISNQEIKKSHAKTMTALLASQANISIAQTSFSPPSVYIRGGDSSHVLILVDGVPFYDPSTIQKTININSIDVRTVEQIEVIKGSQSVVYGGQALSGVIKIRTLNKKNENSAKIYADAGSFSQSTLGSTASIKLSDLWGFKADVSLNKKEALSPVLNSSKTYPSAQTNVGAAFTYQGDFSGFIKLNSSTDNTDIATTAFPNYFAADTNNYHTTSTQLSLVSSLEARKLILQPALSISLLKNNRYYEQDAVSGSGSATNLDYDGDLQAARLDLKLFSNMNLTINAGASLTAEQLISRDQNVQQSNDSVDYLGAYTKFNYYISENTVYEAGLRLDNDQNKNYYLTYQAGITLSQNYKLEVATGFKNPSLFQLFSSFGDKNLKPETSTTASLSAYKTFEKNISTSLTLFYSQFENLVDARGSPSKYTNIAKSRTYGFEASLTAKEFIPTYDLNTNFGYQDPKNLENDSWLLRRPKYTASLKITKNAETFNLSAEGIYN